jgi:5'-methylthioadenosine phosphorylase
MIVGIIGGSGITARLLDEGGETRAVETAFGSATVVLGTVAGTPVAFLPRHGEGHSLLPHEVNYRANALAFHALGVTRVLATSACGSLRAGLPPGALALLTDFIDFTRARPWTLARAPDTAEDSRTRFHVDMTDPYCPTLRAAIAAVAVEQGLPLHPSVTYLCVEGPRYETHAEIRLFQTWGADVVGMTGVPEVTLARELGLCYASVAIVTNVAAGLSAQRLTHAEVEARVAAVRDQVRGLLRTAVPVVAALPGCPHHPSRRSA